ncbi:hypothetical protein [Kitasatospora brasiliensis]|uniref:hypothetical protein n=1 Tax=Kitasatospora brasiliensis TaxID=3058040 RepID=UPI00292E7523|nr:hypothetical protein [Kitasatospora sp. K002]
MAAPPVQRLPATTRPPQPSPAQPPAGASAPATPRHVPTTSPAPAPGTARLLQRVAEQAGLTGVPLTAVPARPPTTVQRAPSPHPAANPAKPPETAPTGPADLDELARRLVEPVGRLLRTELRRGRERSGRPYDMRR